MPILSSNDFKDVTGQGGPVDEEAGARARACSAAFFAARPTVSAPVQAEPAVLVVAGDDNTLLAAALAGAPATEPVPFLSTDVVDRILRKVPVEEKREAPAPGGPLGF